MPATWQQDKNQQHRLYSQAVWCIAIVNQKWSSEGWTQCSMQLCR